MVTVTSTSTISVTDTSTSNVDFTMTSSFSTTETITSDVVSTITSTVGGSGISVAKAKRGITPSPITVTPSVIPTYASACSSFTAYASACACVGHLPSTTTVSAPSVTITVSTTISQTLTLSPTVTISTTITDASATVSITDTTVTVTTVPISTSHITTVTTTTATVATVSTTDTITSTIFVPTATVTVVAPFNLQVTDTSLAGEWLALCPGGELVCFTTNKASASSWMIDENGYIFNSAGNYGNSPLTGAAKSDYVFFDILENALTRDPLICSIDDRGILGCVRQATGNGYMAAVTQPQTGNLVWNLLESLGLGVLMGSPITIQAVAV
ncbi:hypothetical protein AA313_de0209260 [Arthrobotrys entomopaga]|nr:hypothetical protein AA313_de0209260 [Arthrobotrys entomopaga]